MLRHPILRITSAVCRRNSPEAGAEPMQGLDLVDVDLTKLSSTMVYSEVYHLIYNPDDYIAKPLKWRQFAYYRTLTQKINILPA